MSSFLDPLDVRLISDDSHAMFEYLNLFRYQSDISGLITIAIGFTSDFESMPRWIPILSNLLMYITYKAAGVHDWLYWTAIVDRETADKVLYEAMGVTGVPQDKRDLIFAGVRIGGQAAWDAHRTAGHSILDFNKEENLPNEA